MQLLTPREAAETIGTTPYKIRKAINEGTLKGYRPANAPRFLFITKPDLTEYVRSHVKER